MLLIRYFVLGISLSIYLISGKQFPAKNGNLSISGCLLQNLFAKNKCVIGVAIFIYKLQNS